MNLPKDEVHLWLIDLDQPEACRERLAAVLPADERDRAARFLQRQHQDRFRVGRGALRTVLGRYLATEPATLEFSYGAHGKPVLAGAAGLAFNLSHSHRWALLGVARGAEIGVDIEATRDLPDMTAVAERTFTARENRALDALPAGLYKRGFYACWTRKEAMVKAAGVGFAYELGWFEVPVDPMIEHFEVEVGGAPAIAGSYSIRCLEPVAGFPAAVAIRSDPRGARPLSLRFRLDTFRLQS